jgi:hypothetical protein
MMKSKRYDGRASSTHGEEEEYIWDSEREIRRKRDH